MTANERTVRRKWVQKVLMITSLACIIIVVAWGAHTAYHAFSIWRRGDADVSICRRARSDEHEGVRVICPAVQAADRQRTCDPSESMLQPELVVSGKVTETKDNDGSTSVFTIQVEDVIYGSWPKATLQLDHYWHISSKKERTIFTFVPKVYHCEGEGQFDLKAIFDVSEAKAIRALCDARLDYNTLASQCIFVGKEIRYKGDYIRQVEVIRPLAGPALKKGERLDVRFMEYMQNSDDKPMLHSQPEIYFIVDISRKKNQPPIYEIATRQPADQAKKVLAALARRSEYPVREEKDGDGETHKYREVMFRGSLDDAVEMLGSTSEGASTLAARLLLYKSDAACPLVISAIEKQMFKFAKPEYRRYRHLNLLVKLLGAMDDDESKIALGRLIDRMIAYIESGKPPPPTVPEGLSYKREEHKEWANHILAWLLMQLDEKSVAAKYGKPLLKLRDNVTGQWKREVQLALDACRVEDIFELRVAYSRMSKIKPVRSVAPLQAGGREVAFSRDGKFLAAGTRIWNTSDWSPAGGFKDDGSLERLIFSADGKFLYVFGGCDRPVHKRIDWRTGKVRKNFKGHKGGLTWAELSTDGGTMVTGSYYEEVIHVWDTATGKITKSFELPDGCYHFTLSPDGKTLVRQTGRKELTVESLGRGGKTGRITLAESEMNELAFSSDGKYLLASAYSLMLGGDVSREGIELYLYDVPSGFKLKSRRYMNTHRCTSIAVSPDSKYLAIGDQDGRAWVLALPDLKQIEQIIAKKGRQINLGSIAFSPDGKTLVIGDRSDSVRMFQVPAFTPIRTGAGHSGQIVAIYFQPDGKTVRSVGYDNTVCLRDAATLKVIKRISLPKGYEFISARPGDGRYALCALPEKSRSLHMDPRTGSESKLPAIKIVNLVTGKTVSHLEMYIPWNYTATRLIWLDDKEALCMANGTWRRFNYLTGKILDTREIDINAQNRLFNGRGELTEDGKKLFLWDRSGGKFVTSEIEVWTVDVKTANASKKTRSRQNICGGYNLRGLIPGGKYFYVADPDMYILSRKTGKIVALRSFRGVDLLGVTFSPDGKHYAVVTGGRIFIDENLQQWDPETRSIVRIHETLTGKTVLAFPAPSRWMRGIEFSPDGKRLAVVTDKGSIEIWNLDLRSNVPLRKSDNVKQND